MRIARPKRSFVVVCNLLLPNGRKVTWLLDEYFVPRFASNLGVVPESRRWSARPAQCLDGSSGLTVARSFD